jgi:hypothetical protein
MSVGMTQPLVICFAIGTTTPPCGTGGTFTYTSTACGTLAVASDAPVR